VDAAAAKTEDTAVYEAGVTALQPKFAILDKALHEGEGFLVGRRFTVADLNVAEIIRYAQAAPELFTDMPHVQSWISGCQSRPAFTAMMAERNAEPI
jgi:glutathione S-transferase